MGMMADLERDGRLEALRENRDHFHLFAFAQGRRPPEALIAEALGVVRPGCAWPAQGQGSRGRRARGQGPARSQGVEQPTGGAGTARKPAPCAAPASAERPRDRRTRPSSAPVLDSCHHQAGADLLGQLEDRAHVHHVADASLHLDAGAAARDAVAGDHPDGAGAVVELVGAVAEERHALDDVALEADVLLARVLLGLGQDPGDGRPRAAQGRQAECAQQKEECGASRPSRCRPW